MGGSTSTPITSLADMRTVPRTPSPRLRALRSSEAAMLCMASAPLRRVSAASVGRRPACERVNRVVPSAVSSSATCLPTVGCVRPRARAAPESEPSSSTASKERYSSHPISLAIEKRIAPVKDWAISFYPRSADDNAITTSSPLFQEFFMSDSSTVLVLGATGGIGGEMARLLLARGWQVRAMKRGLGVARQQQGGIEWVEGDALKA